MTEMELCDVEAAEPVPGAPIDQNEAGNKIGLAFSGGGIRSASLSSGFLRRLLEGEVKADYISCVSGGNYTAASYVDWKYRNDNQDNHEWHKEFFEQMRENAGYVCNWQKPWKGILDSLLLVILLLFVNIVFPFAIWGSFSIPVAYVVDLLFGDVIRIGFNCSPVNRSGENITTCGGDFNKDHQDIKQPIILFAVLIISFVFLFIAKGLVPASQRFKVLFLDLVSGLVLAFVFLPWLIQQFFDIAPWYLSIIIIILSVFFWLGFPLLRKKASLALVFYFYAFVTRWRVYKGTSPLEYTERDFFALLFTAGVVTWASPFLGIFSNTAIYTFYKWRLQKAFFHEKSSGTCGCQGIGCPDFFPVLSGLCCCITRKEDPCRAAPAVLTMHDIKDVKPQYISNVAVDYWRKSTEKSPFGLLSISPVEVERVDWQPGDPRFQDAFCPKNIKVADAMTISGSVMTASDANDESFRDLQILLGLAIRKHIKSYHRTDNARRLISKIVPFLLQSLVALPLVFLAVIHFFGQDTRLTEWYIMLVFSAYVFLFTAVACFPEDEKYGESFYEIVRWCHVHLYAVRFLRELLRVTKHGKDPPALLALSDAGRLEKFGLIPLLKRRLRKIVIVDGSYIRGNKDYAKCLVKSLKLARKELGCEFIGYDGRDVLGEVEKTYVQPYPEEKHQRSYKFLVRYFQDLQNLPSRNSPQRFEEMGIGEILILAPRHPIDGVNLPDLERERLGQDFVLRADEVDRLTFCCCEGCHSSLSCIQKASRSLCSGFPSHSTANQFFTPSQFTAYHREGYRACVEAGVEGFLKDFSTVTTSYLTIV